MRSSRLIHSRSFIGMLSLLMLAGVCRQSAEAAGSTAGDDKGIRTVTGIVQNQDLRRVPSAIVEVKNQEGEPITTAVTDDAGEFSITLPADGTYSVSAVTDTYRSQYVVLKIGGEKPTPLVLTLAITQEIALDVVSSL